MNTHSRLVRLSMTALLGLSVISAGMAPAAADEAPVKKQVEFDRTTTGSVVPAGKACDPNDLHGTVFCKLPHGDRDVRYPAAPANPVFGF